jgi:hypothetical protein
LVVSINAISRAPRKYSENPIKMRRASARRYPAPS